MNISRVLLVSNRLPVSIKTAGDRFDVVPSAGGLAVGLRGPHEHGGGLWIGWPGELESLGSEARADLSRGLGALRTVPVPLGRAEARDFYEGVANGVIWPLFHYLMDRVPLRMPAWSAYEHANARFADTICEHARPGDTIWIHDFHLMLLPAMLRARLPRTRIGFFLHIPFPSSEVFRILPWRDQILEGLLGADLIGFHTFAYLRHFTTSTAAPKFVSES